MLAALQALIFTCIFFQVQPEDVPRSFLDFILSPCKCRCGIPNREARFLGGEYLQGYEFPWLALLHVPSRGKSSDLPQSIIPATLINDRYLVTAATPLLGLTPFDIKASLGHFDKCSSEISSMNTSVSRVLIHPDYSQENKAHDIALVQLSRPVGIERRIAPVCLAFPGHDYLGQVATVVNWPPESCRPKKLGLPVLDKKRCLQTLPVKDSFSEDKGCIGLYGAPSVICKDDAGTPVLYRSHSGVYDLIGILTEQNDCTKDSNSTALYVKINEQLSWIKKNTRDACYCIKT